MRPSPINLPGGSGSTDGRRRLPGRNGLLLERLPPGRSPLPWVVVLVVMAWSFVLGFCDLGDAECTDAENEKIRHLSVLAVAGFAAAVPAAIVLVWLRRTGV